MEFSAPASKQAIFTLVYEDMQNIRQKTHDILRWSEKYTKTDMVYLGKGGLWLSVIQASGAISALILSIFFAHFFPKDSFGTYKYVLALSGIIGSLTLTGLGPAITQSVARGFEGSLKQGFKENFKWGLGIIVVSLVGSTYYFLHDNFILAVSLIIIAIASPIIDGASYFSSYLSGKKDFRTLAKLSAVGNVLSALFLVCTLLVTKNILIIIGIYFASYTAIAYCSYFYTLHKHKPGNTTDPEMIPYAKHLTLMGIVSTLAEQADKVIVFHYAGAIELAIYTFAVAIPTQIRGLLKGIAVLAFPKFAAGDLETARKSIPRKMLTFFLIVLPVILIYILCAPLIYKVLFPQYVSAVKMSQIFSLSLLAYSNVIPGAFLQAQKKIKSLYSVHITVSVIRIFMLFIGIQLFGVWGIIYARIAHEFVGLIISLIFTQMPLKSEAVLTANS